MTVPTIVTIGKATQDVFLKSSKAFEPHMHKGVLYEQLPLGQKLDLDEVVFATGGNASNAAVTFARQNLHSKYVWALGTDISSQAILQELDKEGVDTSCVAQQEGYRPSYSVILSASNGERTILNYHGTDLSHDGGSIDLAVFAAADWVYLSALGSMELLEAIISKCVEYGVKVMLNPASAELKEIEKLKTLLDDVTVLAVNKEEAQQIVEGQSLEELARHITHYCDVAVVSDGPSGAIITDGKTIVTLGMYEDVPVVDRTGAGDAFGSGFLSQFAQGKSIKDSAVFASANSTSVIEKIGAKEGILHFGAVLHDMPITEKPF